jgi:hypothetical protein
VRSRTAIEPERGLQPRDFVNSPNEHPVTGSPLVPVDPERRALEVRIDLAKARLFQDLNRASHLAKRAAKQAAGVAGRGLLRVALVGGLLLLGLTAALIRRRRRLRVVWK